MGVFTNSVMTTLTLADGKILVGRQFAGYGVYNTKNYLTKLNADGTLDSYWDTQGAGVNGGGYVTSIVEQADGKILIGGQFTSYNVTTRNNMLRLNADGSLDSSWNTQGAGVNITAYSITEQTDGKLLIGGTFTSYNGDYFPYLLKLEEDGKIENID